LWIVLQDARNESKSFGDSMYGVIKYAKTDDGTDSKEAMIMFEIDEF